MNFTVDTSGRQGMQALRKIRDLHPGLPVILMTGWATVALAVEGMKAGARDFIAKPWDNKTLLGTIRTILELEQKPAAGGREQVTNFDHLIGEDPAFLEVLELAERVSRTDAGVLLLGESGTGKELFAEAIHYNSSRQDRPFVRVNLGGISESLFESELFGHKKGAFTDAVADREGRFTKAESGTIFLDEIGDLSLNSQVKLLRVLQEKTYEVLGSSQPLRSDVRVISATNKDLEALIAEGKFREDLYYRINLIKIEIPPLRRRREDIPLLVNHFLDNLRPIYQRPGLRVEPAALEWLRRQDFPGNIRQLKNLVERTVVLSTTDELRREDFRQHYREGGKPAGADALPSVGALSLEEMETEMIRKAMAYHRGNITQVARSLGITRSALYRRLQKYRIPYDA